MSQTLSELLLVLLYLVATVFFFSGLDDTIMDVLYLIKGRRSANRLNWNTLDGVAAKRIAVMIPAWDEGRVIAEMVRINRELIVYPETRYDLFIGTYPNDEATQVALSRAGSRAFNVHVVVNRTPGPSTKAENLNTIYNAICDWERQHGCRFDILVLHDAEDLIHPLSLKLYNYLIPAHDYVQIPVVPMQPSGPRRLFWGYLTRGTYADEFAENHFRHMLTREAWGAFIPSAGVGTAFSRDAVARLAVEHGGAPFAVGSLTEDYEFALRLTRLGLKGVYYAEGVSRLGANGRIAHEFVATKEVFPNSFRQAVRQKTRWIYGITFQTPARISWRGNTLPQRYSLYRDLKSKFTNLVNVPALIANILVLRWWFAPDLLPVRGGDLLFGFLLPANFIFSLVRFVTRGLAVGRIYGPLEAFYAVLVPPLFPLRYLWGNLINFAATLRAWRIHVFGNSAQKRRWAKTSHDLFAPAREIAAYRRRLGDLLMQKGILDGEMLRDLLAKQAEERIPLGELLLRSGAVSETGLLAALGELTGRGVIALTDQFLHPGLAEILPKSIATSHGVVPIADGGKTLVVATSRPLSRQAVSELAAATNRQIFWTLATAISVLRATVVVYREGLGETGSPRFGERLLEAGVISPAQLLEALNRQAELGEPLGQIMVNMGFLTAEQVEKLLPARTDQAAKA